MSILAVVQHPLYCLRVLLVFTQSVFVTYVCRAPCSKFFSTNWSTRVWCAVHYAHESVTSFCTSIAVRDRMFCLLLAITGTSPGSFDFAKLITTRDLMISTSWRFVVRVGKSIASAEATLTWLNTSPCNARKWWGTWSRNTNCNLRSLSVLTEGQH